MGERQFGPYLLVQQIAVGGMAEIHLAKTHGIAGFEKYVALKMIHPNFSSDEQFIEMLIDEAKISVQLQHVNVAQTFDLGRVGDVYYITMEFVDGSDLYKLLRRASERGIQMPVDVAAYIAKEMANGLDYAHRKRDLSGQPLGIVHRDVSPQNVLISHSGEVKLVDFGIAKATMKASQTAVGVIKGKYYYMSPEQAWGDIVDHRTDIFSTGICLYEALTGQMLYLEEDLRMLLDSVRKAEIPPPTRRRRDIPPQLERIVMSALQGDRDRRYQSAGDMATDLERFLHVYSPVFTPAKVAEFFRTVIDDEQPSPVESEPVPQRMPNVPMHTMGLEPDQILSDSEEFADENSIIFDTRQPQGGPGFQSDAGFSTSAPTMAGLPGGPAVGGVPNIGDYANDYGSDDLDNIEDNTMVSGPPGFGIPGGGINPALTNVGQESTLQGTGMEFQDVEVPMPGGPSIDDVHDGPTLLQNDGGGIQAKLREYNQRAAAQQAAAPANGARPGPPPRPNAAAGRPPLPSAPPPRPPPRPNPKRTRKGKGPAHPAVAASTPQPAVSLTGGRRRRPRRTPTGSDDSGGPGGSLIGALVGRESAGAPVKRAPSAPPSPQPPPPHQPAPGYPGAGYQSPPPGPAPGYQSPPPGPVPGYPSPAPGPAPGYPGPAGAVAFGTDQPSVQSPLPSGQPPASFTKQLQALELEEIPDSYKVGRRAPRWIFAGLLIAGCIAAGVALGIALLGNQEKQTALLIESIPAGASVKLNGIQLPDVTPVRHNVTPGQRYEIVFELAGFQTKSHKVVVPAEGGEFRVPVGLQRIRVSVEVHSTPPAELSVNGVIEGQTPRTLTDLDPDSEYIIELKKRGYQPHKQKLDLSIDKLNSRLEIELERNRR